MKNQYALIIVPEIPYPPKNGFHVRHCSIIDLISSDINCDLITINSNKKVSHIKSCQLLKDKLRIKDIKIFQNQYKSKKYASIIGLLKNKLPGSAFYDSKELKKFLKNYQNYNQYNFILILGGISMLQYGEKIQKKSIIWDMCDDSVLVYRRLAKLTNKFVKKILFYFQAQKIRLYIKKYSKLFDKILVISKKDGKILENFYTNEIIDIPNIVFTQGKNINNFKKVKNKNPKILFTGAMQTRANRDAVKYFINEIFPIIETDLNNIEIHFVGSGADLLKINNRKNIFLTGYVDDLSEHYYGSDVYICPLRAGSGIKNKILEAMACGCSIVTSSIGIEGLNVQNGKEVLISDNAKDFAFSVKRLIDDSKLRSYLGINARKFIEKAYDYENTKKKLLQAIFLVR